MKPLSVIILTVLLVSGGYAVFRVVRSLQIPPQVDISSYDGFKDLLPARCHFSGGSGANRVDGDLYVLNRLARFDFTDTESGQSVLVHMIVDSELLAWAWNDNATDGVKSTYEALARRSHLSRAQFADCSAWWLPNGNMVIVPQNVNFSE